MKIKTLAKLWKKEAKAFTKNERYAFHLPLVESANIDESEAMGDPLYEGIGQTPRFLELSRKYLTLINKEQKAAND